MSYRKLSLLILMTLFTFQNCDNTKSSQTTLKNTIQQETIEEESINQLWPSDYKTFERSTALERLKTKISEQQDIVIHAFVPLCDNENQGIVPVSATLGNGLDLRNNLYWGAMYGIKSYFKNKTQWKILATQKEVAPNILERVVFYKKHPKGSHVYFVADAYRGDKIKPCLEDYFNSIAGKLSNTIKVEGQSIAINGKADFLIFNGHNGLMDNEVEYVENADNIIKDVAAIGCISHDYFKDHLKIAKGYPLLMTTNLMAPEAYVMEAVIESWLNLNTGAQIRVNTGKAYHKFQKCGLRGATNLFRTGW